MTLIPIASFLAGSLLSLLLPALLLIALVVWYMRFLRKAPDAGPGRSPADAGNPGQATLPPEGARIGEGADGGGHPAV